MPLHLLGKKSWNVYNTDNIERVRRDEAAARAREEADEQRMQEEDAERRLKILRGEAVSPLPDPVLPGVAPEKARRVNKDVGIGRERKRRRIAGEDDTEREMRYAREDAVATHGGQEKELQLVKGEGRDAPLTDHKGNISLFPIDEKAVQRQKSQQKNREVEADKKKKEKEFEDQYTMRFDNAAGFKKSVEEKPWYYTMGPMENGGAPGKDVWGNEDPRRKEREQGRVERDDPLQMIRRGVKGVREVEKERRKWKDEKRREIEALDDEERRERKRRRKRREEELGIEGFSLDAGDRGRKGEKEKRLSHGHRERSRSPERYKRHRNRRRHGYGHVQQS